MCGSSGTVPPDASAVTGYRQEATPRKNKAGRQGQEACAASCPHPRLRNSASTLRCLTPKLLDATVGRGGRQDAAVKQSRSLVQSHLEAESSLITAVRIAVVQPGRWRKVRRSAAVGISIGGIARPVGLDPDANAAQLIAVLTRGRTGSLCLSRTLRGT